MFTDKKNNFTEKQIYFEALLNLMEILDYSTCRLLIKSYFLD